MARTRDYQEALLEALKDPETRTQPTYSRRDPHRVTLACSMSARMVEVVFLSPFTGQVA